MSPFRYEDRDSTATSIITMVVGAAAGFAAGMLVAQRFGGFSTLTGRLRERFGDVIEGERSVYEIDDLDEYEDDELEGGHSAGGYDPNDEDAELEERVLEAFRNDPILSERAVDIGAVGEATIELSGWVHDEEEADHAVTITRGVPGIEIVVNRLVVGEDEEELLENAEKYMNGDSDTAGGVWEGQQIGTGRRRQGTSAEVDRHADPKPKLEDRWLSEKEALRERAEDPSALSDAPARGKKGAKGGRTDGSAVAPTGVPKSDHVANPVESPESTREG
jgi:hypothetical protein